MTGYTEPLYFVETNEDYHSKRHGFVVLLLIAMLIIGGIAAFKLAALPSTFNGDVDVHALQSDPTAYSLENADGAAYVIVAENQEKTAAQNVCFSVVFNFRGYDTMGESFILIAACAGALCILRTPKHGKESLTGNETEKEAE